MIKYLSFVFILVVPSLIFSQDGEWIKTEGEVTDIVYHRSKRLLKASGSVKFKLENGEEMTSSVELVRIPLYGCINAIGDKISIKYNKQNPGLVQTPLGNFIFNYGMYILIFLGIIFSIKPFLKMRKNANVAQ
ncbi:MAG: DUF3592 domain-containing protein [Crocinitomicaceae bacterium]